jgi:hypothetical protein
VEAETGFVDHILGEFDMKQPAHRVYQGSTPSAGDDVAARTFAADARCVVRHLVLSLARRVRMRCLALLPSGAARACTNGRHARHAANPG